MGLYAIDCPACGAPHMWFSGSMDQRCAACKAPREWTIQEAQTTLLPPDLRVAQRRFPGEVDPSPHWIPVIEKSAYDFQCKQLNEVIEISNNRILVLSKEIEQLRSQLLTEKAEVGRLLALNKRKNKS